jgi:hypothetical protein
VFSSTKFKIANAAYDALAFTNSLLACLEFTAFHQLSRSAEEGRNDTKYPTLRNTCVGSRLERRYGVRGALSRDDFWEGL